MDPCLNESMGSHPTLVIALCKDEGLSSTPADEGLAGKKAQSHDSHEG